MKCQCNGYVRLHIRPYLAFGSVKGPPTTIFSNNSPPVTNGSTRNNLVCDARTSFTPTMYLCRIIFMIASSSFTLSWWHSSGIVNTLIAQVSSVSVLTADLTLIRNNSKDYKHDYKCSKNQTKMNYSYFPKRPSPNVLNNSYFPTFFRICNKLIACCNKLTVLKATPRSSKIECR